MDLSFKKMTYPISPDLVLSTRRVLEKNALSATGLTLSSSTTLT